MLEKILQMLQGLPQELITLIVSALPISELRGAIPISLSMHQPIVKTYCLAVTGNLIPVVPLLFFLQPVSAYLRRFRLWEGFFKWLFERTERRSFLLQRFGFFGLALFVALPLPITGAWTGCAAATLFKLRFGYAFTAITLGVMISGFIVTSATLLGMSLF